MTSYPAHYFARGITRRECLCERKIRTCVFDFDKEIRPDHNRELSIIWLIDKESIEYAKKQKNRKGEEQFKLGFAIVGNLILDFLIKENNNRLSHYLDYAPHGLILSDLGRLGLKTISQHLAESSEYRSYSDEIPCDN